MRESRATLDKASLLALSGPPLARGAERVEGARPTHQAIIEEFGFVSPNGAVRALLGAFSFCCLFRTYARAAIVFVDELRPPQAAVREQQNWLRWCRRIIAPPWPSCRDQTALPSRLPGLLRPLAFAEAHAWAAAVFVDEFDAGTFQRATNCGIIGGCHRRSLVRPVPRDGWWPHQPLIARRSCARHDSARAALICALVKADLFAL